MLGLIVGSVGSGRLITKFGRYKMFPVAGTAIMAFGLFLLSRWDADTSRLIQIVYMAVLGLGVGLVMQVLVLAVQNAVDHRDLGVATSASSFFRSMGGAFGVAVFGAILTSSLNAKLADLAGLNGDVDAAAIQSGPEAIAALPLGVRNDVVDAFAGALHVVFLWGVPVAVLAFVVVLFLRERPLRESVHVGFEAMAEDPGLGVEPVVPSDRAPGLLGDVSPPAPHGD